MWTGGSRPDRPCPRTLPRMDRRSAYVLLAVVGAGVFLAGLELMVTAVALPSILADLADPSSGSAWVELRKAVVDHQRLPAGLHPDDADGRSAGRPVGRAPAVPRCAGRVHRRVRAGRARPRRWTSSSPRGSSRPSAAGCSCRSGPRSPRTCSVARCGRGRSGVVGALTFLGMAAGPVVGAAILASFHPEAAIANAGLRGTTIEAAHSTPAWRWVFYINIPIGIIALVLAWAASPDWETPHRARPGRHRRGCDLRVGPGRRAAWADPARARRTSPGTQLDPIVVTLGLLAVAGDRHGGGGRPRAARGRSVHRPAPVPEHPVLVGRAGVVADRLRVRDGDHRRGGLRRPRAVRRPGRSSGSRSGRWPVRRRSGRSCLGSSSASFRSGWWRLPGSR